MTLARKPLPPLTRAPAKLPPLRRSGADSAAEAPDWLLAMKLPRRGNCATCAGRGRFVWHASEHITLDCEACGGTGA